MTSGDTYAVLISCLGTFAICSRIWCDPHMYKQMKHRRRSAKSIEVPKTLHLTKHSKIACHYFLAWAPMYWSFDALSKKSFYSTQLNSALLWHACSWTAEQLNSWIAKYSSIRSIISCLEWYHFVQDYVLWAEYVRFISGGIILAKSRAYRNYCRRWRLNYHRQTPTLWVFYLH